MLRVLVLCLTVFLNRPAAACETALLLAVDVSGSIGRDEYLLQMHGLAAALMAPEITDALVADRVALALVAWSGDGYHQLTLPWHRIATAADVARVAALIRTAKRPADYTDTAIGEAIRFSIAQFADVPDCNRRVIDISGDGEENAGLTLPAARTEAQQARVTVNALAIEANIEATPLSRYFGQFVITRDGFVMTALGLQDYPRAIYTKLLRELTVPTM